MAYSDKQEKRVQLIIGNLDYRNEAVETKNQTAPQRKEIYNAQSTLITKASCAMLAAEAFYSYEYFSTYIAEEKRRERFLNALIRCEFKANIRNAEVNFITARKNGKIVAVAQLCMPGFKSPSDMRYLTSGYLGAVWTGGIRAVTAWLKMEEKASAPCHELPGRNWYLSLFTVAKSDEGTGIGSNFLKEYLIPYVKAADGECLSLFTNSKINCRFYEKNGFSLFDEKAFEYEGKTIGSWSYRMKLN